MNRVSAPIVHPSQSTTSRSTSSKYSSSFDRSCPPSTCPNSLHHNLQVQTIIDSKCISNLLDYTLQVYLIVHSILPSKCISKLTRSQRDATADLEGRELIINTPLHLSRHQGEFMAKSCSGLRSLGWEWEDMKGYSAVINHTNCMDLWMLSKSEYRTTQIEWIYESSSWVQRTKSWERKSLYFI